MKKSLATLNSYEQHKMKWTARFGYAMFALVVINSLFELYSVSQGLMHLNNGGGRYLPQFLWFISASLFAAVVPPIVAYVVGGREAKTNSEYEHHYNGVLFALLAGWLTIAASFIPWPSFSEQSWFYIPALSAVVSLAVVVVLALSYGRHSRQVQLQQYAPYRAALMIVIIGLTGAGLFSTAQSIVESKDPTLLGMIVAPVLVASLIIWFGYRASREHDHWSRLIDSLIALSIGMWTTDLFMLFMMSLHVISFIQEAPLLIGILAWALYLYLIHLRAPVAAPRRNKR